MLSEEQFKVLSTIKSITDELFRSPRSKYWRQRYDEECEVLRNLKEREGKRGEVYCEKCEYRHGSGTAQPIQMMECHAPIENWYSSKTPRMTKCSIENKNNNCPDFKEKEKS